MAGTYADITDVACDVVIIGAGVIGCAAAYNLAKKGRSVTVLDRESNVGEGWGPTSSTSNAATCAWARPRNTCRRFANWRACRRAWGSI